MSCPFCALLLALNETRGICSNCISEAAERFARILVQGTWTEGGYRPQPRGTAVVLSHYDIPYA